VKPDRQDAPEHVDYRDRRGHVYALFDQEETRRVTERPVGAERLAGSRRDG